MSDATPVPDIEEIPWAAIPVSDLMGDAWSNALELDAFLPLTIDWAPEMLDHGLITQSEGHTCLHLRPQLHGRHKPVDGSTFSKEAVNFENSAGYESSVSLESDPMSDHLRSEISAKFLAGLATEGGKLYLLQVVADAVPMAKTSQIYSARSSFARREMIKLDLGLVLLNLALLTEASRSHCADLVTLRKDTEAKVDIAVKRLKYFLLSVGGQPTESSRGPSGPSSQGSTK